MKLLKSNHLNHSQVDVKFNETWHQYQQRCKNFQKNKKPSKNVLRFLEIHGFIKTQMKHYGYPLLILILFTAMTYLNYNRSIYFPRVVITKWKLGSVSVLTYMWYVLCFSLIRLYYFNEFLCLYKTETRKVCSRMERTIHTQLHEVEAAYFSLRRFNLFLFQLEKFRYRLVLVWKYFFQHLKTADIHQRNINEYSKHSLHLVESLSDAIESCIKDCISENNTSVVKDFEEERKSGNERIEPDFLPKKRKFWSNTKLEVENKGDDYTCFTYTDTVFSKFERRFEKIFQKYRKHYAMLRTRGLLQAKKFIMPMIKEEKEEHFPHPNNKSSIYKKHSSFETMNDSVNPEKNLELESPSSNTYLTEEYDQDELNDTDEVWQSTSTESLLGKIKLCETLAQILESSDSVSSSITTDSKP